MYTAQELLVAQEKIKLLQGVARNVQMDDRDPVTLQYVEIQLNGAMNLINDMMESRGNPGKEGISDDRITLTEDAADND